MTKNNIRKLNKHKAKVAELEARVAELKLASETIKEDPSVETIEEIIKLVSVICGLSLNIVNSQK